MTLGRVVGTVVSTRKDERLRGFKLLVVKAIDPGGKEKASYLVAVDTVDAGMGELVLVVSGSSARMSSGCEDRPVDAAVVGIIDTIDLSTVELAGASAEA
jgi:ethanolamine utilization protein EutN